MSVLSATAAALLILAGPAAAPPLSASSVSGASVSGASVAGSLVSGSLVSGSEVEPPVAGASVSLKIVNGSGCAQGTTTLRLSDDNREVLVRFDEYTARVGGGARPIESRKTCQLAFELVVPMGYTYVVTGADVGGEAHVEAGASMRVYESIYWAGSALPVKRPLQLSGPFDGGWHDFVEIGPFERAYLPCGEPRYSNVASEVRVLAGTSKADAATWASLSPAGGGASIAYHLMWLSC